MSSTNTEEDGKHYHGDAEVTVRTPAGASHTFPFTLNELVARADAQAIGYFVEHGELATGDYGLAVLRDGKPVEMADTARLGDYHLVDGDVLHLVVEEPQVDGG